MAVGTVRVRGLRETVRAFNKLEKSVSKEIRDSLKKLAEPVRASAERRLLRYQGVGPIRVRSRVGSVFVEQTARKVTGLRPDFGSLQMRRGFVPALHEHRDEIRRGVEGTLDFVTRSEGF